MNYQELFDIGCNRGFVQWTRSGRIEKLRVTRTTANGRRKGQMVLLASLLPLDSPEHCIFAPMEPHEFLCVEINRTTPVRVGGIFL